MRAGLTVVVLTYNSADTLGECLAGLAGQEDPDFDVLVVDDDSTDGTLAVAQGFADRLRLRVATNGTHSIPRGRNIGLDRAGTHWVGFIDSDDRPTPAWTRIVRETFAADPGIALVCGELLPAHRTRTAQAIALNDDAVRRLAGGGVLRVAAGNCAINRQAWAQARFDDDFPAAEDLELAARLTAAGHRWVHVPQLRIHHHSRDTLRAYARQMYRYGAMKQVFAYATGIYRPLDYVPLVLVAAGALAGAVLGAWWPALAVVPFSLLEAAFVIVYQKCPAPVAARSFPAWLVKNVAWSAGILRGTARLLADRGLRRRLRSERSERSPRRKVVTA